MSNINYKNALQEYAQKINSELPTYKQIRIPVSNLWYSTVTYNNISITGNQCTRKIAADLSAAEMALKSIDPSDDIENIILNKYEPFDLFTHALNMPQTDKISVLIDYENINKLEHLHNLWSHSGKILPILKFVAHDNPHAEKYTSTHIIPCSGKDAVDHFISTFIGFHLSVAHMKTVIILTRDGFGEHHSLFYRDVHNGIKPKVHYCTSERVCVKLLKHLGCKKENIIPHYKFDSNLPVSWEYLKIYNNSYNINYSFNRTNEIKAKYHMALSDGTANMKISNIIETLKKQDYYFIRNDFPYHIKDNILHYLFWHKDKYTIGEAKKNILSNHANIENLIIFTNSRIVQSVLELSHYHVFIKEKI
uniref:DRBM domain-containing protein n=1 Tax=viral metagenome TaxID=1070528 RepID=A0A6C0J5V7_9ZZZZ